MAKNALKYTFVAAVAATFLSAFVGSSAKERPARTFAGFDEEEKVTSPAPAPTPAPKLKTFKQPAPPPLVVDSPKTTPKLKYKFKDESVQDPLNYPNDGGLKLTDPSNIKKEVTYDPTTGNYILTQKLGTMDYRPATYMTPEEYEDYKIHQQVKSYWRKKTAAEDVKKTSRALIPTLHVNNALFDAIFGGNTVDIRPQGTAELIFGVNNSTTDNPVLPVKQRSITTFDFNEKIQLNVIGKIGDKLKLSTNYNTEATFDFENQMKLEYNGHEDEIIKKIEAGNVSLPLTGSLITGSTSLFGVKTQLQFGKLMTTLVFSQQKGKKSEINVTGGAQISKFEVNADNYESNRHFFLSHYFRDRYNVALSALPIVQSTINITKVEVWVTNRSSIVTDLRSIVAFADMGEDTSRVSKYLKGTQVHDLDPLGNLPYSNANDLYKQIADTVTGLLRDRNFNNVALHLAPTKFTVARDYERLESARKLAPNEFTINPRLGFISLNQALNYDEILGVAFQYTLNGKVYQVGEFSTDGITAPKPLYLKMLKGTTVDPTLPIWKLMMKNVYSIGGYQINPQDFKLEVWYNNISTGVDINYLPTGPFKYKPLLQTMNLDRINQQGDVTPDGLFDFIDGVTINAANGRIFFPVTDPFGLNLSHKIALAGGTPADTAQYAFPQLYDSTRTAALQFPQLDRFKLKGSFKSSSSSEISLNTVNVPQGSVTVTAGGIKLTENADYTVDYTLGRVKIINEGILNSGTPIKISLESNSLFAIQTKTMMGAHFDYKVNKDFILGGTIMNLTERPLTQKVNIGDEPINNTVIGVDGNYRTAAPFLTKLVDKLPFFSTKAPSNIVSSVEAAKLFPGHNAAIGQNGNAYIDDFEGSISKIDIKAPQAWSLASIPQGQPALFPEGAYFDSLPTGYNRAKLNWYILDPLFIRQIDGLTPKNITTTVMSNNFTREVLETELFPNKQLPSGLPSNTPVFDLAYYPDERGPYNYDANGLDVNGKLTAPASRWGGIMRRVETNDFEATNIEYLQFWMMDPFNSDNTDKSTTGDLYVNLGNISEDVLKDSRKSFENGLPPVATDDTEYPGFQWDQTHWGRVPRSLSIVNAFDVNESARPFQDVGLDGLTNDAENSFFSNYLSQIAAKWGTTSLAYINAISDPSGDDYHFYRGGDYDGDATKTTLERYKKYNGPDGNSPAAGQAAHGTAEGYTTSATTTPNSEDINRDNTLSESEGYFQYKISMRPSDFSSVGSNYITDKLVTNGQNIKDGSTKPITWYQIKIPIHEFDSKVGSIQDFRSIRFIRLFFKGVDKRIICRFARMEFVRGEWRIYTDPLLADGEYKGGDANTTSFETAAVNIEENGNRTPINYVLPPGIQRQINVASSNLAMLNEQALSLKVCDLKDGDARATYRNLNLDIRMYKRIKMFIHGEAGPNGDALRNGDLRVFIRLGTDFANNYYEYEIPLQVTAPGNYNGGDDGQQHLVWPSANELDLEFAKLQTAKEKRNADLPKGPSIASLTQRYATADGNNMIYIMGNPNIAGVKSVMIGIRNPKQQFGSTSDDGLSKCAEVWVNELRLSDFNEEGGWASLARVKADLADLGSVSIAGNYSTAGWGSLEQKMNDRQKSTNYGYDFASNFELGKFLPTNLNIKVPMYFGYSEAFIVPQYDPLDPDILLSSELADPLLSQAHRDSLKRVTVDYTQRKSLNFTNVKKEKAKNSKTSFPWDIENVSVSYSYSEINHRDVNVEHNNTRTHKAMLTYGYSPKPKAIKPFEKTSLNPKYFALIKDFNFSPMPSRFGFTTTMDRFYNESQTRNNTGSSDVIIPTLYNKTFTWNRAYDLKWDITKALKVDYTANNDARILEAPDNLSDQQKKDTIIKNIESFGANIKYRQALNINYAIPINKLPYLDFTSANVRYSATYDWTRAPFGADTMGNTIQNSSAWTWNGQMNMGTLYNKIPYFKKLATKPLGGGTKEDKEKEKKKKEAEYKAALKKWEADTSKVKKPKPKLEKDNPYEILEYVGRIVMSVKNITLNYTENAGTMLPGVNRTPTILGMNNFNGPTPGFVFGSQEDIRQKAISNDWLVKTRSINTAYTNTNTYNFTARMNVEPLPDLKIELNANRNYSNSHSEFFRWGYDSTYNRDMFLHQSPTQTGNFSMSFISIRTAWETDNSSHTSDSWQQFLNNRSTISRYRAEQYVRTTLTYNKSTGYYDGYSSTSQDVTIPAFLAAYAGHSPTKSDLNIFPTIPLPNWRVTYDGLSKLETLKKYFKSIVLSHAYRSSYNVSSFTQNLDYVGGADGLTSVRDATSNFVPQLVIGSVSISEQFAPLFKIETTFHNSLLASFEWKKERNLSLSMANIQLNELDSRDIVIGMGYRIKNLKINILKRKFKSDLNTKVDVSFKNNITIIRKAEENTSQATAGQNIITIKISVDYVLSDRLTVRAFYDRIANTPVISSSYPTSNTNAGISLRFTLAQ